MAEVIVYHNLYINNFFNSFIRSMADFFSTNWFPRTRTKDIVIGTYEKAIEREKNRRENASENYSPSFPFITFNPSLDFEPEDMVGNYLHQYAEYGSWFNAQQWNPRIYEDDNLYLAPCFNRYRGEFEVIIWCSSVFELMDYRTRCFQFFGGLNRIIMPEFEGYFVLPDSISLYSFENPYTGESYKINWDESLAETYLIRNINQNKMVFPFNIKPMLKLQSIADGSTSYGNTSEDEISEHRITVSIEWSTWLPTQIVLVARALPTPCKYFQLDINVGFQYSQASKQAESTITTPIHKLITWMDNEDSSALSSVQLIWDQSYCYFLTAEDIATLEDSKNINITLPKELQDCIYLLIYTKFGELTRDIQWKLSSDNIVDIIGMNADDFSEGDMLSFEIYKKDSE